MNNSASDYESIINKFKDLHTKLHRIPKICDIKMHYSNEFIHQIKITFGGYNHLLEACGLDHNLKYSDEDLIYYMLKLKEKLNRTPDAIDMENEKNFPHTSTYQDRFGTWNNALEAAKLKLNRKNSYSKKELINILINLNVTLGRVPNLHDFAQDNNLPCHAMFRLKFGSFNNALREAGLETNVRDSYTDEELLDSIKKFINLTRRIPTCADFDGVDYPYHSIITKRFNTWKNAIFKATGEAYIPSLYASCQYKSNHGHVRPSVIDGKVDDIIGQTNLNHEHELLYSNFLSCDRLYSFDYVITHDSQLYFIEVAGILTRKQYNKPSRIKDKVKKQYLNTLLNKIDLCRNKVNLIVIFNGDNSLDIISKNIPNFTIDKNNIKKTGSITCNRKNDYKSKKRFTDDQLKENIINFYTKHGRLPFLREMNQEDLPYSSIYTKRKNWSEWLIEVINEKKMKVGRIELHNRRIPVKKLWDSK